MDTKTQTSDPVQYPQPQHSQPQYSQPQYSQPQYTQSHQEITPVQPSYQGHGAPQHQPNGNRGPVTVHATPLNGLGALPAIIDCPFCHQRAQTRVDEHSSGMTVVVGIGIGLFCICAACLPCIFHWFADVDHYCTNCTQRVCHIPQGGVPQVISPTVSVPQEYAMGNHQPYGGQHPTGPQLVQQPQEPQQPPQYAK